MSKAEIIAFEYAKENGTLGLDYNKIYDAVKYGYYQAEKDLELTVDDIKNIDRLLNQCVDCTNPYQEVLKQFKAQKGDIVVDE